MKRDRSSFDEWVAAMNDRDYAQANALHQSMVGDLAEGERQAVQAFDYQTAKRYKQESDTLEQNMRKHLRGNCKITTSVGGSALAISPPAEVPQTDSQTTVAPLMLKKGTKVVLRGTSKYDGCMGCLEEDAGEEGRVIVRLFLNFFNPRKVRVPFTKLEPVSVGTVSNTANTSAGKSPDEWQVRTVKRMIGGIQVDETFDEKLLEKLHKMKALADNPGATPAESMQAFGRYMNRLQKLGLEKTTGDISEDIAVATLQIPKTTSRGVSRVFSKENWTPISNTVAKKMHVNYYRDHKPQQHHTLCVYGEYQDVVVSANILVSILNMLEHGATKYRGEDKKSYKAGFVTGVRNAMDDSVFSNQLKSNMGREEINAYLGEDGNDEEEYGALVLRAQNEVQRRRDCLKRMEDKNSRSLKTLCPQVKLWSSRGSSAGPAKKDNSAYNQGHRDGTAGANNCSGGVERMMIM